MEKLSFLSWHNYSNLSSNEAPASEQSDHALEEQQHELFRHRQHRRLVLVNRILAASTVALVIICLWLGWKLQAAKFASMGSLEYGFKYELGKRSMSKHPIFTAGRAANYLPLLRCKYRAPQTLLKACSNARCY